jgi:hypothetical protein
MNRSAALLVLAAGLLSASAFGQSNPPASPPGAPTFQPAPSTPGSASPSTQAAATTCLPAKTLDDLIKALDDAISGPADKDRACMRQLFYPDSRMIPVGRTREGLFAPRVLTIDNWIDAVQKRGTGAFYERQIKVKSETFAHIAHLWATYEIRPTPDGKATVRGVNSIQAVFDGARWRITQIEWQPETPTEPIPEQYLP